MAMVCLLESCEAYRLSDRYALAVCNGGDCTNPAHNQRGILFATLTHQKSFFTMHRVAISSTGLFTPPEIITNEELVVAFNAYAALENAKYADEIAAGTRTAITDSATAV